MRGEIMACFAWKTHNWFKWRTQCENNSSNNNNDEKNRKNNNSQRNSQWWNPFAYHKKIMNGIMVGHSSIAGKQKYERPHGVCVMWHIQIEPSQSIIIPNRRDGTGRDGEGKGNAADWLNAKSLNPIQSHWQQLGSSRRFFLALLLPQSKLTNGRLAA